MWTVVAETAGAGGGSDNLWTLLGIVASTLIVTAGTLLTRRRRRHPEVEPEPVARRVVLSVEGLLDKRVKQLEKQIERDEVRHERRTHTLQARIDSLIEALATCRAERADLMYRLRNPDGSDD